MPSCSSRSVPIAWMLIGTFCAVSWRLLAVTTTSSRPPEFSGCCAWTTVAPVSMAPASGIPWVTASARRECSRRIFRRLARVMISSPIVGGAVPAPCAAKSKPAAGESKLRHRRVALEHGSQRLFQRPEPRFVVAPVIDALLENGPSHLLRARRAHGARVLVKAQHALFERQVAVIEQPAHFGLGVLDHALVEHT